MASFKVTSTGKYQVISRNDATNSASILKSFNDKDEAISYALSWFGNPDRKRKFAWMQLRDNINHTSEEIVRGTL